MRHDPVMHPGLPDRFNPRTRKGCDSNIVSTEKPSSGFNPRTRKGCDVPSSVFFNASKSFNPRTRKGCDWDERILS